MILSKIKSTFFEETRRIIKTLVYGFDDIKTGYEAAPYGTDSNPIAGMVAIYAETSEKGNQVIVGYLNKNQLAGPGEHRIYSTDSDGNLKFSIWLKADGTCEIGGNTHHLTQFEALKTGFDQLVSDFNAHVHASNGVPPTTPSVASVNSAKIAELKTL
jgi:hypothetical protein